MADFDLHIKDGTVVDGTRVPRYRADVWIREGRIAQIGGRAPGLARRVIDADGAIVASGFIDLHTHSTRRSAGTPTALSPDGTA
jgi:N-acyl-D-amino-acid deacylase